MKTIDEMNKKYLCMGCGTCVAICPTNAIRMNIEDIYYPIVDKDKCTKCGKCVEVCPGISIFVKKMADEFWPNNKWHPKLGRFRATYIGYSNNPKIRFNSASGGIATSIICSLLKKGIIDGAILTKMSDSNPLQPESFIARTEEEVISAQTSKYCPTSPVAVIKELKHTKEKFAFVGLPCQVHGVRKLQNQTEWVRKKIILTIGLFCSHGITFPGTCVLLNKFAKGIKNIRKIQYRGRGWPGGINVKYKNGEEFNIPLGEYWPPLFAPYFFTPYRCLTCHDLTSELADISLGDAWLREVRETDNIGTSVIIVRSSKGVEVLASMKRDNEISLRAISYKKVIESQQGVLARKKVGVGARMKLLRFLSKPVPEYDQEFSSSLSGYIGASLILFNSIISKTKFGQKLLEIIPTKFLKKYCDYVFKYSTK